jgi:hypothetical protein
LLLLIGQELGMASPRRRLVLNPDARELEAQRIACSYLVKGCERALFDFGLIAGDMGGIETARIDERAAHIMRAVLGSWRDTLSLLTDHLTDRDFADSSDVWTVMRTAASGNPAIKSQLD